MTVMRPAIGVAASSKKASHVEMLTLRSKDDDFGTIAVAFATGLIAKRARVVGGNSASASDHWNSFIWAEWPKSCFLLAQRCALKVRDWHSSTPQTEERPPSDER